MFRFFVARFAWLGWRRTPHHYLLVLLFELYILDAKAKLFCSIKRVS